MQTEAIFENIAERIQCEILKAQKSIFIAVAWFTNKKLFNELVNKANDGCTVFLIISNDRINENSQIDYSRLNIHKSKVYKVGNGDTELMHNKFCVIDYSIIITGSYNWSYKAENNFENIIITSDDSALAEQFIAEFNIIRKQYYPNEPINEIDFPLEKIIKRLEILKNYIILEDIDELNREVAKIRAYSFNNDIAEIIFNIKKHEFSYAVNKILNFISKNQSLSIWSDPEIAALKFEIKNLEYQLNAFDNEKIELEKILSEFHYRNAIELGDIILELLRLRKIKYKDDKAKYEEAFNDEKEYQKEVKEEKEKEIYELTEEQKAELKKSFRKATMLCHPDKFQNESIEIQKQAEELFKELNNANAKNDMKRVIEILANLEKGILTTSWSDKENDKEKLRETIEKLKIKIQKLETEIIRIKQSDTFQTIVDIKDWDEYFAKTKEQLQEELDSLKKELGE